MPITLQPSWRPIVIPGDAKGAPFPIVADESRGVVVFGDTAAIQVCEVLSRQRLWFTVQARNGITGFAVGGGVLYVQDGPVLTAWSLTEVAFEDGRTMGFCQAAYNLASGASAASDDAPLEGPNLDAVYASPHGVPAYSAPVVRQHQLSGGTSAMVFVLDGNGALHGLDDALSNRVELALDPPLTPMLAIAEIADPSNPNIVTCTVATVTRAGAVQAVDASTNTLKPLGSWPAQNAPDATHLLPPAFVDDTLWTGGVLHTALCALHLPPASAPVFAVPDTPPQATPWTAFDVSPLDRLALLTNGTQTWLRSYDGASQLANRWGSHAAPAMSWTMFWNDDQRAAGQPGFILEIDRASGASNVALRVYLANTVDTRQEYAKAYPPAPALLAGGTIEPGTFAGVLSRVAAMDGAPCISRREMYAVVDDGQGKRALISVSLQDVMQAAQSAAAAEQARLRKLASPVQINCRWVRHDDDNYPQIIDEYGGYPGQSVTVTPSNGWAPFAFTTDGNSNVLLDASYDGMAATFATAGHTVVATVSNDGGNTLTFDLGLWDDTL